MDHNELLSKATKQLCNISANKVFFVKDLFLGAEWNALGRGDKLGFGRYFKTAVMNGSVPNVEYIGKADNNSAQYKKKPEENL